MFVKANRIMRVYAYKLNYIFAKYLDIISRFTYNSGSHDIVAQLLELHFGHVSYRPSYPPLSMSTTYLVQCKFALSFCPFVKQMLATLKTQTITILVRLICTTKDGLVDKQ